MHGKDVSNLQGRWVNEMEESEEIKKDFYVCSAKAADRWLECGAREMQAWGFVNGFKDGDIHQSNANRQNQIDLRRVSLLLLRYIVGCRFDKNLNFNCSQQIVSQALKIVSHIKMLFSAVWIWRKDKKLQRSSYQVLT